MKSCCPAERAGDYGWSPVLAGRTQANALEAVRAIGDALQATVAGLGTPGHVPAPDPSLAGGMCGVALFFAQLSKLTGDAADRECALTLLETALGVLQPEAVGIGLLRGTCGVAWTVQHLAEMLHEPGLSCTLDEFDHNLMQIVQGQSKWRYRFDIFDGLVGIGVYALERIPQSCALELVECVIHRLAAHAENATNGVLWDRLPADATSAHSRLRAPKAEPYVDLGMARGMASVIAFLAQVRRNSLVDEDVGDLLSRAVSQLLSYRQSTDTGGYFPYLGTSAIKPVRTSWCYGDLGIGTALRLAAEAQPDAGWYNIATEILADISTVDVGEDPLADACVCHGAAGVGHILTRTYHATGNPGFARSACRWFSRVLDESRRWPSGVGGFRFYWNGQWVPIPGLLRGAAGVGLALLSAASDVAPDWDRLLLMSFRSPEDTGPTSGPDRKVS